MSNLINNSGGTAKKTRQAQDISLRNLTKKLGYAGGTAEKKLSLLGFFGDMSGNLLKKTLLKNPI